MKKTTNKSQLSSLVQLVKPNISDIDINNINIAAECILVGYAWQYDIIMINNWCVLFSKIYLSKKLAYNNNMQLYNFLVMLKQKLHTDKCLMYQKWWIKQIWYICHYSWISLKCINLFTYIAGSIEGIICILTIYVY